MGTTYLVDKKLRNGLLLDANLVLTKYLLTSVALIAIESSTYGLDVGPARIFPVATENKLVFEWMEAEPHISVVEQVECRYDRIILLIQIIVWTLFR